MLYLRTLYQWALAFLVLVIFSGFSGDSVNSTNFIKPQTEIVISKSNDEETTFKYCNSKLYKQNQVTVNQYTVFNFKSLLSWCQLNFSLTFKTQKQRTFDFLDINSILEQNLIAYKYTTPTHTSPVK